MDRQQQRQGHHATSWTRAQSKTLGGADDVGSTVGHDRSHLAEQVEYAGKCCRSADKTCSNSSVDKLAGMMGYTFPDEETQKFREYTNINQIYLDQKLAAVGRLLVFDDGENESLEGDVHSFVDKTTHLTTALLRQGVDMIIP